MYANQDWTFWKKFHDYYLSLGLFKDPNSNAKPYTAVRFNTQNTVFRKQKEATQQTQKRQCIDRKEGDYSINVNYDSDNIIRGRKSVEENLANDTSKDDYIYFKK